MKKRKNTTLTKPVFWKIFLKRMLVIAVIAVTIGVVGTYIASYFYGMHMASVSLESCHRFAKELYYRYDYCENNDYGRPCVRALNAMCRERKIKLDYLNYDFKKVWFM